MTAPALRIRETPDLSARARPRSRQAAPSYLPLARALASAAAAMALVEILVDRAGAILIAYLAPSQPALARGLEAAGSAAAGAVALLVLVSAFVFGSASRRVGRLDWAVLPITAALVVIASTAAWSGATTALHVSVILGAGALVFAPGPSGFMRAAVVCAGFTISLSQMAFLVPTVGDWSVVRTTVEAGLLAVPVLAAIGLVEGGGNRALRIGGIVGAASAVGVVLARPDVSVLLSAWVLGATLSLPLIFYVATAAASGILVAGAIIDPRVRLIAGGVLLLWVAGTTPTAVHHNLSALLGLFLITHTLVESDCGDEEGALCRT